MGMLNAKDYAKHKLGEKVKPKTNTGSEGAKQEHREESDINFIIKRYSQTGHLPPNMQNLAPVFADVSKIGDFGEALRRVDAARDSFAQLDANVRSYFGNNPENLIRFLQDDNNREEAEKLGLVAKKEVPPEPTPEPPAPKPKSKKIPPVEPED